MRSILGRSLRWGLALTGLLAIGWAAWYGYDRGFGRKWRTQLEKEFQRYGLTLNVRKLTLDPFHGLIAQDVEIFDSRAGQVMVAQVDLIALDVDFGSLFQHEPALNSIALNGARVTVPLIPGNSASDKLRFTDLQARIYFLPGRIEVRQASGNFAGIRLALSGTIVHPETLPKLIDESKSASAADEPQFLTAAYRELQLLHYPDHRAQLTLDLQVDLANPRDWRLQNGKMVAPTIRRQNYALANLSADFDLQRNHLHFRRIHVQDDQGELNGAVDWNLVTGEKSFSIQSTLDFVAMLKGDPRLPGLGEWNFAGIPALEIDGSLQNEKLRMIGRLDFDRATVRQVQFEHMHAAFSVAGEEWMITDAQLTHRSGTLTGEALQRKDRFQVHVRTALDPAAILPFAPEMMRGLSAGWKFGAPPLIEAKLEGKSPRITEVQGSGQVWLGRSSYRGTALDFASGAFRLESGKLICSNVHFTQKEGNGGGSFVYDLRRRCLAAADLEAMVMPSVFTSLFTPSAGSLLQAFHFERTPQAILRSITPDSAQNPAFLLQVVATTPFVFRTWFGWEVPFENARVEYRLNSETARLASLVGRLGGGECTVTVNPDHSEHLRSTTLHLTGIDLSAVSGFLQQTPMRDYGGTLSGSLSLRRRNSIPQLQLINGTLRVERANLEHTALFGPVLERLRAFHFGEFPNLEMTFTSGPGSAEFSQLSLVSGEHRLNLLGHIGFIGHEVELTGEILPERLPVHVTGNDLSPVWEIATKRL